MVSIRIKRTVCILIPLFHILFLNFTLHIYSLSTSQNQKSTEKVNLSSSNAYYYNQPYGQGYNYYNSANYSNILPDNLTIEVLPNDDDDDGTFILNKILQTVILSSVYFEMLMDTPIL
ncbi:uncharacterized protein TA12245 [Theileria annulata]|uniref:Uncharacterized protein n=1 Tax=Theileria annulata TaxID=5874 RepID=Q4UDX4_THEAN|nr:uncharacterized protein TA12245 [Theileria annulata]CAI74715.1 hypothetical protein TA12245 [Theileria annulata]|eukprot:XP_952447.1 hypothetical protein TA12245 [Theileria annulata]